MMKATVAAEGDSGAKTIKSTRPFLIGMHTPRTPLHFRSQQRLEIVSLHVNVSKNLAQ
jgi:hypothetical protein